MPVFFANADSTQPARPALSLAVAVAVVALLFATLSPALAKPGDKPGSKRGPNALTEQQVQKRLKVLAEVSPELAERLDQLEQSNPKQAQRMTRRLMPRLTNLVRLKEKDPEQYELRKTEMATGYRLLKQLRLCHQQHEDNQQIEEDELKKLRRLMAAHMDARLKIRELELKRLEQKIERVRAHIDQQRKQRDADLDHRMKEIRDGQFPKHRGMDE